MALAKMHNHRFMQAIHETSVALQDARLNSPKVERSKVLAHYDIMNDRKQGKSSNNNPIRQFQDHLGIQNHLRHLSPETSMISDPELVTKLIQHEVDERDDKQLLEGAISKMKAARKLNHIEFQNGD